MDWRVSDCKSNTFLILGKKSDQTEKEKEYKTTWNLTSQNTVPPWCSSPDSQHEKDWQQHKQERMGSNRNSCPGGWKCKPVQPLGKTVWQFLQKLNVDSPRSQPFPTPPFTQEKWKQTLHTNAHSSFTCDPPKLETTWMSILRRMDEPTMESFLAMMRCESPPLTTLTYLHAEWVKSDPKATTTIFHFYAIAGGAN